MENDKTKMNNLIKQIYDTRSKYIIIGFTGRTGSGCTTAADILADEINFDGLSIDNIFNDKNNKLEKYKTEKEIKIIKDYTIKNWKKFNHIHFKNIISSFILENELREVQKFLDNIVSDSEKERWNKVKNIKEYENFEECYNLFFEKNKKCIEVLDKVKNKVNSITNEEINYAIDYLLCDISKFTESFKGILESLIGYTKVYQCIGNNLRRCGDPLDNKSVKYNKIYTICERVNYLIKIIRRKDNNSYCALDAFRNPVEISFFKERYASFYLIAINCSDEDRIKRMEKINIYEKDIEKIDSKEFKDGSFIDNKDRFVGQDIKQCILYSDILINNVNDESDIKNPIILKYNLYRIVSLIKHPGLVKPTQDEFIMQIAYTASSNSGCLCRNVGAVVTDIENAPIAIGWNCVPHGQIPCNLRNVIDLKKKDDEFGYSKFEREDKKINVEVDKMIHKIFECDDFKESGLPKAYCFKKIKNNSDLDKNQVYTRSLHAEENAYLQILKHTTVGVKRGKLYTTASPCVLCAKKTYQLELDEVIYIDPYPDISQNHTFNEGDHRIKLRLYTGAIGAAYYKLYIPLIPLKDEIYSYS